TAIGGKDKAVGGGGATSDPDSGHPSTHRRRGISGRRPVPEAQAVEESGPQTGIEFAKAGAHQGILGKAGDEREAIVQPGDKNKPQPRFGRAAWADASFDHRIVPALARSPAQEYGRHVAPAAVPVAQLI